MASGREKFSLLLLFAKGKYGDRVWETGGRLVRLAEGLKSFRI